MSGDPGRPGRNLEEDLSGAREAIRDAHGYHDTAVGFRVSGAAASVVFNVAAMAVERYLLAVCYLHGVEPVHHTFGSMMSEVDALVEVPAELSGQVAALDGIFGICSVEDYHHGDPGESDAAGALACCEGLRAVLGRTRTGAGHAA